MCPEVQRPLLSPPSLVPLPTVCTATEEGATEEGADLAVEGGGVWNTPTPIDRYYSSQKYGTGCRPVGGGGGEEGGGGGRGCGRGGGDLAVVAGTALGGAGLLADPPVPLRAHVAVRRPQRGGGGLGEGDLALYGNEGAGVASGTVFHIMRAVRDTPPPQPPPQRISYPL